MCHDIRTKIHKDWLGFPKLFWGYSQTHRKHGDLISLLLLFKNKESGLKNEAFQTNFARIRRHRARMVVSLVSIPATRLHHKLENLTKIKGSWSEWMIFL
jgi:hypothetical protein